MERDRNIKKKVRKLHRRIALRMVSTYRTVSYESAEILASLMPVDIVAQKNKRVHERKRGIVEDTGDQPTKKVMELIRRQEERATIERWRERLQKDHLPGQRVREAIVPCLEDWMKRDHSEMNFSLTQMMTGHGAFREYREKIGKSETAKYQHCPSPRDTAQHTIEICMAWETERRALRRRIRGSLTLENVVKEILQTEDKWKAFSDFCTAMMRKKEEEERRREREQEREEARRRRSGCRVRRDRDRD